MEEQAMCFLNVYNGGSEGDTEVEEPFLFK